MSIALGFLFIPLDKYSIEYKYAGFYSYGNSNVE